MLLLQVSFQDDSVSYWRVGIFGVKHVSELVNEKRTVTPDMAMRLGKALGNGPQIWLRMQQTFDLWELSQRNTYDAIKTPQLA